MKEVAKTGMERVTIYENVPMTQRGGTEMEAAKTWASDKGSEISADLRGMTSQYWYQTIAVGLLEAYERGDKNGYERGRKEIIEDLSDVIGEHEAESDLKVMFAVIRFLDGARLAPPVSKGKLLDDDACGTTFHREDINRKSTCGRKKGHAGPHSWYRDEEPQ